MNAEFENFAQVVDYHTLWFGHSGTTLAKNFQLTNRCVWQSLDSDPGYQFKTTCDYQEHTGIFAWFWDLVMHDRIFYLGLITYDQWVYTHRWRITQNHENLIMLSGKLSTYHHHDIQHLARCKRP